MERLTLAKAYNISFDIETIGTLNGFFSDLYSVLSSSMVEVDFLSTGSQAKQLDFYYYGNVSGDKFVSPFIEKCCVGSSLKYAMREPIALTFWSMFGDTLIREWNNYKAEYDPIENYSMTEHEETEDAATGTDTSTDSFTNYKETVKLGHTITNDSDSDIYGLDSGSGGADADKSHSTTVFGDNTDRGDTKEIEGSKINEFEHGKTDNIERDLTRHGHLPVGNAAVTTQKLLVEDIELWQWNFYINYLFPKVDKVLALPIY